MNTTDFELTGEFKVSICGPDNLFFIGHNVFDFIARSDDGIHWNKLDTMDECILCHLEDNFKFNEILLKIVEKCNITLYLYVNDRDDICIRYDEKYGNSNLIN